MFGAPHSERQRSRGHAHTACIHRHSHFVSRYPAPAPAPAAPAAARRHLRLRPDRPTARAVDPVYGPSTWTWCAAPVSPAGRPFAVLFAGS
eukprot:scaffold16110_cov148-Isochrysis_galbana.AAC.3